MGDHTAFRNLLVCLAALCAVGGALPSASAADAKSSRKAPPVVTPTDRPSVADSDPAPGTMPEAARVERIAMKRPADRAAHLAAARHYLEQSYGADSRLQDASRHVSAVLAAEPTNFDALMLAGDIANRRHQPDVAAQHYSKATLSKPDSKEAFLSLAGALDQSGDHAGAEAAFSKFRALNGMRPLPADETKTH
jgi:Flp pilus assembly protein TadD